MCKTAFRPPEFQGHIASIFVTRLGQPFPECGDLRDPLGGGAGIEKPNHRHRRLLRARRKRPCRRAAEQRDERAAFHVWMAPAWQEIIWRASQRSLAVMCPACWCSPGGLLALMGCANRVLIIQTGS